MIPEQEAKFQRVLTSIFIKADASEITLVPAEYASNGSGGRKRTDLPARLPQTMRLVPTSPSVERETLDGVISTPSHSLLGEWDAAMARGDRFEHNDLRYEVVFIADKRDYQTKGEVITRGTA